MGLHHVEILLEVEKFFGINIPDAECEKATTVGAFHELAWYYVQASNSGYERNDMERIINHIVAKIAGIDEADIRPEQHFVKDLGIN